MISFHEPLNIESIESELTGFYQSFLNLQDKNELDLWDIIKNPIFDNPLFSPSECIIEKIKSIYDNFALEIITQILPELINMKEALIKKKIIKAEDKFAVFIHTFSKTSLKIKDLLDKLSTLRDFFLELKTKHNDFDFLEIIDIPLLKYYNNGNDLFFSNPNTFIAVIKTRASNFDNVISTQIILELLNMKRALICKNIINKEHAFALNIDEFIKKMTNQYHYHRIDDLYFFSNTALILSWSLLGISLFAIAAFVPGAGFLIPYFTPLFASSFMTLCGTSYAMLSIQLACRMSLPYYLLGHIKKQRSGTLSNSPTVQAISWGIMAGSLLSFGAGVIFYFVSATVQFCATSLFPWIALGMVGICLGAEIFARYSAYQFAKNKKDFLGNPLPDYFNKKDDIEQSNAFLLHMNSIEEMANYCGTDRRNMLIYLGGFSSAILSIILCSTLGHSALPAWMFTAFFAQTLPLIVSAIMFVGILSAVLYYSYNKDLQVENLPYQLTEKKFSF